MLKNIELPTIQKPIGILGGTFDPIHVGHLRMALELYDAFNLDKIHIIPCYQPVHRKLPNASPQDRFAMVSCAVLEEPALYADPREINRKMPSYMIDTVLELRRERPLTPLCLLLGIDAFLGFLSWHKWEEILCHTHLIIAYRPNYQLPTTGNIAELIKERLETKLDVIQQQVSGKLFFHPITALEISASEIRKQIALQKKSTLLIA